MDKKTWDMIQEYIKRSEEKLKATCQDSFVADAVEDLCWAVRILCAEVDRLDCGKKE
jgi:hypothetical protein